MPVAPKPTDSSLAFPALDFGRGQWGRNQRSGSECSVSQKSIPPPATNLVILAGDLLAVATKTMLDELAGAGHWPAAVRVRQCLDAYEQARVGDEITSAQSDDPQRCNVNDWPPAPETEKSAHHG